VIHKKYTRNIPVGTNNIHVKEEKDRLTNIAYEWFIPPRLFKLNRILNE